MARCKSFINLNSIFYRQIIMMKETCLHIHVRHQNLATEIEAQTNVITFIKELCKHGFTVTLYVTGQNIAVKVNAVRNLGGLCGIIVMLLYYALMLIIL